MAYSFGKHLCVVITSSQLGSYYQNMNRQQRRASNRQSSNGNRRAAIAGLAVTSVAASSLGVISPATAAPANTTATSCSTFAAALPSLATNGGTLTANFTGTCSITTQIQLLEATTIVGPTTGTLKLVKNIGNSVTLIHAQNELTIRNLTLEVGTSDTGRLLEVIPSGSLPAVTLSHDAFLGARSAGLNDGGAIYVEGHVSIDHSRFFDNEANFGGAIYMYTAGSDLTISSSTFDSNTSPSGNGGAIYANTGIAVSVTNSSFTSNEATVGSGGAIYSEGAVTVKGSTFFNNSADAGTGGALFVPNGTIDVDNSTFVNNSAIDAGAMFSEGGIVSNSTIWNNSNTGGGGNGAVYTNNGSFFANILANEGTTTVVGGSVTDLGANLYTDASFTSSTLGAGLSKRVTLASLKLKSLAFNKTLPTNSGATKTVALGDGSSAVNYYKADSAGIAPTFNLVSRLASNDQRGAARPIGGSFDVGAYEKGAAPAPKPTPTPTPKPTTSYVGHARVLFRGDSARLTPHAKAQLRVVAASVMANKVHNITLDGHTATLTKADPSGRHLRGKIAGARTRAVEKYLKKQFKKAGYTVTITRVIKGAADPVKSNRTEAGRKANRRVYITVQ